MRTASITHSRLLTTLAGAAVVLFSASALAAGSGLPGDQGRPDNGIPAANPPPRPGSVPMDMRDHARAPPIALALQAAQAIVAGCSQYRLGVTVVNAKGAPILVYIPDGSKPSHAYMALRKAYTAITFQEPTSRLTSKAQHDPAFAARIEADPNLVAYSGGLLIRSGGEIIGAIGVSGAEPGHHDEECARIGLRKIEGRLK